MDRLAISTAERDERNVHSIFLCVSWLCLGAERSESFGWGCGCHVSVSVPSKCDLPPPSATVEETGAVVRMGRSGIHSFHSVY